MIRDEFKNVDKKTINQKANKKRQQMGERAYFAKKLSVSMILLGFLPQKEQLLIPFARLVSVLQKEKATLFHFLLLLTDFFTIWFALLRARLLMLHTEKSL